MKSPATQSVPPGLFPAPALNRFDVLRSRILRKPLLDRTDKEIVQLEALELLRSYPDHAITIRDLVLDWMVTECFGGDQCDGL